MSGLYGAAFVEQLRQGVLSALGEWGLSPATEVRLLTVSENATFRADDPEADAPVVIRVHRPGYHTRAEIRSELAWIAALREEDLARIPAPLSSRSGDQIVGFRTEGELRDAVAFSFLPGSEPAPDAGLTRGFSELGRISAGLHRHARNWQRPAGFVRKAWTFETTVGARPHWGDWREALGLTAEGRAVLERCAQKLEVHLSRYGAGPERFGLIHADLRLANLLIDETGRIGLIDFDDCGFGWFMYDFAAAVSFFEDDPVVPALAEAWVSGYREIAPLGDADVAMLPGLVMLRRLLLTAWIASHSETPTALELGAGYTDGTIALAERFLAAPE